MGGLRSLAAWLTLLVLGLGRANPAAAQVNNQSFQVTPMSGRVTVGDSVTVKFRVRLDERDLLFDTIPQPVSDLGPGVRLLSVDKMVRTPDRIFHGTARLAFYRTGRRAVPVFGVPFMRAVKGLQRGMLTSDTAFVEVVPLLPAGNPSLKDIKEPEPSRRLNFGPLLVALAAAAALGTLFFRARKRRAAPSPEAIPLSAPEAERPRTPYDEAQHRLDAIERAGWSRRGEVERHYEAVVDVLRDYLEAAHGLGAREQTSAELLWALPPHLAEAEGRARLADLLDEADLVKFAQYRPGAASAGEFLQRARSLLGQWNTAAPAEELSDAVR